MTREATPLDVIEGCAKWTCLVGDAREMLRDVPDGCAQTCVTSPPYFGLRDYGNAEQIGQEPTPREFVDALVAVMREVRRVLADDGTLWLNVGDSYAASTRGSSGKGDKQRSNAGTLLEDRRWRVPDGYKAKDLLGIPWRLAFALQDDGWYLRSDIIWAKPNPMPESVTDRPTRAHEYVFLLSKRARYFYDADAIREPHTDPRPSKNGASALRGQRALRATTQNGIDTAERWFSEGGRNARDVWTITPEPCAEAHFATMPPDLARRCVLAGSRRGDVVLDPFGGAGTTALAALGLGRRALLCELNPAYVEIQRRRLAVFDADASSPIAAPSPEWGDLFATLAP
jgi:site-specific DNA-methyltransferase (adenine-specific)